MPGNGGAIQHGRRVSTQPYVGADRPCLEFNSSIRLFVMASGPVTLRLRPHVQQHVEATFDLPKESIDLLLRPVAERVDRA